MAYQERKYEFNHFSKNETTLTNYVTLDSLILPWNPPGHLLKYGGVIGCRLSFWVSIWLD
jgi:hypothetical protein